MNTRTNSKSGFANNLVVQMALLVIAAVVLVAVAWKYLW
jgi:hypothetical protein